MELKLDPPHPRVEINGRAQLSSDRRTIVNALMIDGISYDIDIDFSQGNAFAHYQRTIPKIQAIWAQMAEQALPDVRPPSNYWQMECSYISGSQKASVTVISDGVSYDRTDNISFDAKKLKEALGESGQFIKDYASNGRTSALKVMEYVNNYLMNPSYVYDVIPPSSSRLDPSIGSRKKLLSDSDSDSELKDIGSNWSKKTLFSIKTNNFTPPPPSSSEPVPEPVVVPQPPNHLASKQDEEQDDGFIPATPEGEALAGQTQDLLGLVRNLFL